MDNIWTTAPLQVPASADFEAADSNYMSRTFGTPTSQIKWTLAFWFKRETVSVEQHILNYGVDGNNASAVILTSTNHLAQFDFRAAAYGSRVSDATSIGDTNWHHGCIRYDTAVASPSSDRVRIYTDGVLATSFEFSTYPAQGYSSGYLNTAVGHNLGREVVGGGNHFDGLLADVWFIDGQSLGAEYFVTTSPLAPRHYDGPAVGVNGFRLAFRDGSNMGTDSGGAGNDWTESDPPTFSTTVPP